MFQNIEDAVIAYLDKNGIESSKAIHRTGFYCIAVKSTR